LPQILSVFVIRSFALITTEVYKLLSLHVCQPSMWNLPSLLNCILGYEDMGAKQGRETLISNAKKHCSRKLHSYELVTFNVRTIFLLPRVGSGAQNRPTPSPGRMS